MSADVDPAELAPDLAPDLASDLDTAREVADTVLYEGYVLFPYRADATKNRYRWQWGVIAPTDHVTAGGGAGEGAVVVSQTVLRADRAARILVTVRFLRARRRQVHDRDDRPVEELEVDGELLTTWDEGEEHTASTDRVLVADLVRESCLVDIDLAATEDVEEVIDDDGAIAARVVRRSEAVRGRLTVSAEPLPGGVYRVTARVDNPTDWSDPDAPREEMLRHSLLGVHLLEVADNAVFGSVVDPPDWARAAVAGAHSQGSHPVLVGDHDRVVLSAPIILADHPEIASESPGQSFDATEIDELLTLAVHGLSDEEKRRARATDPRAAAIVDRAEILPPRLLAHLHGTIRDFQPNRDRDPDQVGPEPAGPQVGGWDAGGWDGGDDHGSDDHGDVIDVGVTRATVADPRGDPRFAPVSPDLGGPSIDDDTFETLGVDEAPIDHVVVAGERISVGARVRVTPGRRADAQDIFLVGRTATVARIVADVDGDTHIAVTMDDDPAAELHTWYGRYLYFRTDEVHPLDEEERP